MASVSLEVRGMTCASCVGRVERSLRKIEGVTHAIVNLATERATVDYQPDLIGTDGLRAAIVGAGYEAHVRADDASSAAAEVSQEGSLGASRRDVLAAAAFAGPLVFFTMLPMLVPALHEAWGPLTHFFMGWGGLLFAAPVQLWAGRRFYRQGIAELLLCIRVRPDIAPPRTSK